MNRLLLLTRKLMTHLGWCDGRSGDLRTINNALLYIFWHNSFSHSSTPSSNHVKRYSSEKE